MRVAAITNLTGLVRALLPDGMQRILHSVSTAARHSGARPYLVGGPVRDLLLGRRHTDIDLTIEGDAIALAEAVGAALDAPVTAYNAFGSATLHLPWRRWEEAGDPAARLPASQAGLTVDLAVARTERYPAPGALPVISPGASLVIDLHRRDFTANAMAMALTEPEYGRLIDPYGGGDDLAAGRLAVLHPASFNDDPTRLVRGVRLAGRLWLRFAPETETLAFAAVANAGLARLSGERRRHELDLLLADQRPALALSLGRRYALLEQIHPAIVWDAWLAERLCRDAPWLATLPRERARLALLTYRWPPATIEHAVRDLQIDAPTAAALRALPILRQRRDQLAMTTSRSTIAQLLDGLPAITLAAGRLAEDAPAIAQALDWYMLDGVQRRPRLGGGALRQLGLPPGPAYRPILAALRAAVLDGLLPDETAEWEFLRQQIADAPPIVINTQE